MNVNELLDDSALDPKKLFNEEEYSTLIVNRDGFSKQDNHVTDLMLTLLDKKITRHECEEIYAELKKLNSANLMVNTIKLSKRKADTSKLVEACWECGLDFTPYYLTFAELACDNDFKLAFESMTVIQECTGEVDKSVIDMALKLIEETKSRNTSIIHDLRQNIAQRGL